MPGQQPKEPKDFGRKSPADQPTALSVVLYQERGKGCQKSSLFISFYVATHKGEIEKGTSSAYSWPRARVFQVLW